MTTESYLLLAFACLGVAGALLLRGLVKPVDEKWVVLRMEQDGEWRPLCEVPTYAAGVEEVALLRETDSVMRLYSVERLS